MARAGTTTPFHTGATLATGQANYDGLSTPYGAGVRGTYRARTTAVGSFAANAFGRTATKIPPAAALPAASAWCAAAPAPTGRSCCARPTAVGAPRPSATTSTTSTASASPAAARSPRAHRRPALDRVPTPCRITTAEHSLRIRRARNLPGTEDRSRPRCAECLGNSARALLLPHVLTPRPLAATRPRPPAVGRRRIGPLWCLRIAQRQSAPWRVHRGVPP